MDRLKKILVPGVEVFVADTQRYECECCKGILDFPIISKGTIQKHVAVHIDSEIRQIHAGYLFYRNVKHIYLKKLDACYAFGLPDKQEAPKTCPNCTKYLAQRLLEKCKDLKVQNLCLREIEAIAKSIELIPKKIFKELMEYFRVSMEVDQVFTIKKRHVFDMFLSVGGDFVDTNLYEEIVKKIFIEGLEVKSERF